MIMPYGPAIADALSRPDASTEELLTLRHQAHAILQSQGELAAAVERLEAELSRRGAKRA